MQSYMNKIIFDVDGVIVDLNTPFEVWMEKKHPSILLNEDLWSYGLPDEQAFEFFNAFFDDWEIDKLAIYPGAEEGLQYLRSHHPEYKIMLISALPERYSEKRKANLNGLPYCSLDCLDYKLDFLLKESRTASMVFEDCPDNINYLLARGIPCRILVPINPVTIGFVGKWPDHKVVMYDRTMMKYAIEDELERLRREVA